MKLSKTVTLAGIVLSNFIGCSSNRYLIEPVNSSKSAKLPNNSNISLLVDNFNNDINSPDIIVSTPKGIEMHYVKKIKDENTMMNKMIYPEMSKRASKKHLEKTNLDDFIYSGSIAKEYIDDDNYVDIAHSKINDKDVAINILFNDGKGNFGVKQTLYIKNSNKDYDQFSDSAPITILNDDHGLYLVTCVGDSILRFKADYNGVFNYKPEVLFELPKGFGKNISHLSTGYFNNDEIDDLAFRKSNEKSNNISTENTSNILSVTNSSVSDDTNYRGEHKQFKDLLVTSLDGVYLLTTFDGDNFTKSGLLYNPKLTDNISNKNAICAVTMDMYNNEFGDKLTLDEILYVNNKYITRYKNTSRGRFLRGEKIGKIELDGNGDISIGADCFKKSENFYLHIGTPDKLKTYHIPTSDD